MTRQRQTAETKSKNWMSSQNWCQEETSRELFGSQSHQTHNRHQNPETADRVEHGDTLLFAAVSFSGTQNAKRYNPEQILFRYTWTSDKCKSNLSETPSICLSVMPSFHFISSSPDRCSHVPWDSLTFPCHDVTYSWTLEQHEQECFPLFQSACPSLFVTFLLRERQH